jgi:hypothetical protein
MQFSEKKQNDDSKESPTAAYKRENEYVMALPRTVIKDAARPAYPDSVLWLLYKKLLSLKILRHYLVEAITGRKWLAMTSALKGRGRLVNAIVIGNGPSQGYLDEGSLSEFKKNGGEIICINLWTDNEVFSHILPNYMVVSDSRMFTADLPEILQKKQEKLLIVVNANRSIKIICPLNRCDELSKIFGEDRIIGFVDQELRMWTRSTNPLCPRGYVSMTLYKALALAIWFDYRTIYVIGMDNTYPRNIYCDKNNKFISHELHAIAADFVVDQSAVYKCVGDGLTELARLFHDARKFKARKIINLDPYSLTDAFEKSDQLINFQKICEMPREKI